jgi:hypothetical protein
MLRDLLRVHVAPALRSNGYAGSGQNFHRRIGPNWAAVNIQRDRYSTADEVRFTINLGTASTVVRVEDGESPDEPADEVRCHWRTRLGALIPGHNDTWWTVRTRMPPAKVDELGADVARLLVELAVPALDRMASDEAILATWLPAEPESGMVPAAMDVVGPILRRVGPDERLKRYLEIVDREGERSASLYTMFDDFPPARMGPARTARAMERLSAKGFEPRQDAIIALGYAARTDAISDTIRPLLEDPDWRIRFAATQSLGRLRDLQAVPRLRAMVTEEPVRTVAVHAAVALWRMDRQLDPGGRRDVRAALEARRDRALGHDRAALSHFLRDLGTA